MVRGGGGGRRGYTDERKKKLEFVFLCVRGWKRDTGFYPGQEVPCGLGIGAQYGGRSPFVVSGLQPGFLSFLQTHNAA